MCPDVDNPVVTFVVGDETHVEAVGNFFNLSIAFSHKCSLFFRHDDVAEVERQTALECHVVTHVLDVVEELGTARHTARLDYAADDSTQRFL